MMKNLIATCSDAKYGDFLINHWLKSLKDHVDLNKTEIAVMDYGLTAEQIKRLKGQGVIVQKCVRDGFPNSIKFRDIGNFISSKEYDQVLTCDGGDIIFQENINYLFEQDKEMFRAVYEDVSPPFESFINDCFDKEDIKNIKDVLKGKKLVNAGVLLAPYWRFKQLCEECNSLIKNKTFGPDTVAINYILHRENFKELHSKYNFILTTSPHPFYIKNGSFYLKDGNKIPIIHNAGGKPFLRPIKNFGYGENRNKLKRFVYFFVKASIRIINKLR